MLSRHNPVDIDLALRTRAPAPPFPPATDRAAWSALRASVGEETAQAIIVRAEADAQSPIPALPATVWLEFQRVGQREGFQVPRGRRREMLASLTMAECLAGQGRFLDPILNVAWAICEESSWALPAHQRALTDMDAHHIDLGAAMTALQMAEMDALVGPSVDPLLGKRIRYEVNQRCFIPYLTRHDHWWLYNTQLREVNNWTAVCNAGVVGAAIYLEPDLSRLAEMIARAARSCDDYLTTFDSDGGSSEGPGYWSYGFGYYTMLAQLVEQRTDGLIRFLDEEIVYKAAQYPLRTVLSPSVYANFSDCDRTIHFIAAHLAYLARRLDLPDLMRLARSQPNEGKRLGELSWLLRSLAWQPAPRSAAPESAASEPSGDFVPARHDWFAGMMWMFARHAPADPNALVLAAKGGHNGEMHNQNDVGNFIVHVNGESVIPDIGRGRYTRAYFGPERYKHLVNSSRGHSVPLVNGQEQLPGKEFGSQLLAHRADDQVDLMTIEMKGAYPAEADLASLRRTIALHRGLLATESPRGWVEVVDEVSFASGPGQFESVLTTFAQVEVGESSVVLRGEKGALRVTFDPAVVAPSVTLEKDVDFGIGPADVRLVKLALVKPRQQAVVRLRITPET